MTKKKVGILTLPINNNYGGIIQLVALYNFIKSNNFEAIWIDKRHPENIVKIFLKRIIEINPFYKIYDPKNFKTIKLLSKQLEPFLNEYLKKKTQTIYTSESLNKITNDIDSFIVGSDQVWRFEYIKSNYPTYFLDFVPHEKTKIAYAASFGKDYWEGNEKTVLKIKALLKKFDLVTTREKTGLIICQEDFNFNTAVQVLDPSFLQDISFYKDIINKIHFSSKVELFNYVLDSSKKSESLVDEISNQLNLKVNKIYLNYNSNKSENLVENWLAHFYYSDFVITDSFHGMVFSIIFNKQFIVIGNQSRGLTRFYSILELLDLKNRIINIDQFTLKKENILNEKIDFSKVNKKLETQKKISKSTLLNALKN
jgi:exopolysaccharide biosynthesis predicted pyruvyltransferase EpsI